MLSLDRDGINYGYTLAVGLVGCQVFWYGFICTHGFFARIMGYACEGNLVTWLYM
ncbi:hypothetical protein ACJX0J_025565, partial [Zea mays]